jgi:hypothetical protein
MPQLFGDIFTPVVLTKVISERVEASGHYLRHHGLQPGGPHETNMGHGRIGAYHIFNNTLKTASGRAPGTAASRLNPQTASKVPFEYPRQFSSIPLLAEQINNFGRIDDPATRDKAGAKMISLQTNYLAQLAANWRTAMLVGVLRDSLFYVVDGDSWYWQYTNAGGATQIPTQMPAGNKAQLNMLGGGNLITASWATETTDIPGQLMNIHAAFQQLTGAGLMECQTTVAQWNNVIKNDYVQASHGTANPPFDIISKETGRGPDGKPYTTMKARLNFMPWVEWLITDEGLMLGKPGEETYQKHIPANTVIFRGTPVVGNSDIECYIAGEPVAEYDGGPKTEKFGLNAWSRELANPTVTEIFSLDNALVVNQVPRNTAIGTVQF